MTSATVLAHQGGWDEILFVLAPLIVFAGLLALARRRVDHSEDEAGQRRGTEETGTRDGRGR